MKLVTAGGMPLTVHGCASVNLILGQETFESEVVVASPLTSEKIIGIDFLLKEQAAIDILAGRLHLRGRGCDVKLKSPASVNDQVAHYPIGSAETVELPPRSMMQIMGSVKVPTKGVWLLEGPIKKSLPVTVTCTLVEPTNTRIPVHVVNPLEEPITVYSGTVLGTLEEVDTPMINVDAVSPGDLNQIVDQVKQEQLWNLVQVSGAELNQGQREVFYHLLLSYADVLACSTADLGLTDKLTHTIPTGDALPIRQPVRRIPPPRWKERQDLLQQMLERGVIQPSANP